ncbi:hypothetical protein SAMN05660649_03767 [Desulfotomaculum arcticum]|uniref:Uncharacterized protein n=1 Tax=Desulfotruncus arcticus DSM 17038 TaxID=1121424 RepID=A0A1I2X1Q6_9FIRM|nr:hypothetical protein [Desulfotruncus arcticus]SFH07455.1 hypothetical protein SAMN05660649_03767 [Desulfotomaculum arcticum] [Desulfotruncus arcticus DSM 17038]
MTLKELIEKTKENLQDFSFNMSDFLDAFYNSKSTSKYRKNAIKEEPVHYEEIPQYLYAFVAATAHKLAEDYNLEIPNWTLKDIYCLKYPYFAMNAKGNLRLYLLVESPPAFKFRNLYVPENCLSRV